MVSVERKFEVDEDKGDPNQDLFDDAVSFEEKDPMKAEAIYNRLIEEEVRADHESQLKLKEESIYRLGKMLAESRRTEDLRRLFVTIRALFSYIPKARTAKIVRTLIDTAAKADLPLEFQVQVCKEAIVWCKKENRTFLKQRMQSRYSELLLRTERYKESLSLISKLIKEVKKFDDKLLLVEIHLTESRVHDALSNLPKSKGALTSARSAANSTYCPPLLQAQIDKQSGTLCAEEKDYKTGFSYFYEGFEGYSTVGDLKQAIYCLKYMLLCKIMLNQPEDVYSVLAGKTGVKHAGIELEAMRAVTDAYKKRSIHAFEDVYVKYKAQLGDDPVINRHLSDLKGKLLEQNLLRLLEPFSKVEISHVAKLIKLPKDQVEIKLSEMILDKTLSGILDQGTGVLIIYDQTPSDKTYEHALATVKELGGAVDRLYTKAKRLS